MTKTRRIESKDIEKCVELYMKVFNSEPWNDQWTPQSAYSRLNDIAKAPHFVGLVYEEHDAIKGAVFGNQEQWFEGMHYNLREMFVSNDVQGKGIGRKMLAALEQQIRINDVRTVILFTSRGNKTNEFYKKNGFEDYEDMVMMGKDL